MTDTWKPLKQKQKAHITEIMFRLTCDVYAKTGQMPEQSEYEPIARIVYSKCNTSKVNYEDILQVFIQKQSRFEERILTHGIPEPKPVKDKKTEAEKLAIKRANRKRRKAKQKQQEAKVLLAEQDDTFAYIAGYTEGGAPYGLQWWEVGIDPSLPFEEKVRLYENKD